METIKKENNKFYVGENADNVLAEITFVQQDADTIVIDHTYVSDVLRGQGMGQQLVEKAVDYARQENKKIIPLCSFAKKVMLNSNKYKDVLVNI